MGAAATLGALAGLQGAGSRESACFLDPRDLPRASRTAGSIAAMATRTAHAAAEALGRRLPDRIIQALTDDSVSPMIPEW